MKKLLYGLACVGIAAGCGSDPGAAPFIVSTSPSMGQGNLAPSTITIVFSEPMDVDAGSVTIDGAPEASRVWSAGDRALSLTPRELLPAGHTVTVRLESDFRDDSGTTLAAAHVFSFTVPAAGYARPAIVSSLPADGAENVPAGSLSMRFEFSEPMDAATGAVTLFGEASIGDVVWVSPTEAEVLVRGLVGEVRYSVALDGFRSLQGTPLDPIPSLGNGRLDFTTGPDLVGPEVVASTPAEGETSVEATALDRITLVFDEPIDGSAAVAQMNGVYDDGLSLDIEWSATRHEATLVLPDDVALSYDRAYTVTLEGFADVHGNPLQTEPYLLNGMLDFAAGSDARAPRAVASRPFTDGVVSEQFPPADEQYNVFVDFDEPVDFGAITAVLRHEGDDDLPLDVYGTHARGIQISLNGVSLSYGTQYQIALSGVADYAGHALDTTGYLGDGVLDFRFEPDTYPPFVVESQGIRDGTSIPPTGFFETYVALRFSEPIDATAGSVRLVRRDDAMDVEVIDLSGEEHWSDDTSWGAFIDRALLADDSNYRIVFDGLVDQNGLPLDGVPILGDGALDFAVGAPNVVWSSPAAGATIAQPYELYPSSDPALAGVRSRTRLVLRFGEPMDTTIRTVQLTELSSGRTRELEGVWTVAGGESELEVLVTPTVDQALQIEYGQTYELSFADLRDEAGMAVPVGNPFFPGAVLRFSTSPQADGRLLHACGHVLYDVCEGVTAFTTPSPFAPRTAQGHIQYAVHLSPDGMGGFAGYTSLETVDDTFDLLLFLREDVAVRITDMTTGYNVPFRVTDSSNACSLVTARAPNACAQIGEPGITRRLRVRLPRSGQYVARWGSTTDTIHFIAEIEDGAYEDLGE